LSLKLRRALRWPKNIQALFGHVAELSVTCAMPAYVVGGFVRDGLLGVESFDVDIAVEGDALAFAEALAEKVGGQCEAFTRFGTAIVMVPGLGRVDIACTRAESYPRPGALPEVVSAPLSADLVRRDFTLNSIALRLLLRGKTEWLDPSGGLEDLKKGLLRAHHAKTFEDDPTRVFRAVRFEQRFGFKIEPKTLAWLKAAVKGRFLDRVSGERLRNELRLIFAEPHPEKAVKRISGLGVWPRLCAALKKVEDPRDVADALKAYRKLGASIEEPWMVWLSVMVGSLGEEARRSLADRLTLSGVERKVLFQCAGPASAAMKVLKRRGVTLGALHLVLSPLRMETHAVLWAEGNARERKLLLRYEKAMGSLNPFLSGKDLIDLGMRPGPGFATLLEEGLGLQIDRRLKTRSQALKWLENKVLKK
jgi:tRNA nucleotidyltransferase (CCA-adding enzyme)